MNSEHVSDDLIQQYSLSPSGCDAAASEHIAGCALCRAKVANYQMLFTAIGELERPAFAFDLETLVMEKIAPLARPLAWGKMPIGLVVLLAACCIGFICWLNKDLLSVTIKAISADLIGLVVAVIIPVLLFQLLSLQREYQSRMRALDIY
ncbi:MAG TPA: hypothetical protein VFE53_07905 [Mucilaginibacter sp.]|jgi:hypothetical protein|nr:hypothetical protein [Mucilaginibacter sp.]